MKKGLINTNRLFVLSVALLIGVFLSCVALKPDPVSASSGINKTINFQGRLLNSQGAVVPDGYYNIKFRIYQDGDGQSVGDTTGSPAGTLQWAESRLNANSQGVLVQNGFLSVNLGSAASFGSNIDWNQDTLWLSMEIGNTNPTCAPFSTCSPDGEMVPMQRMTAAPYALNSDRLQGLTGSQFVQLAQGVQTDNSAVTSIYINKTGSAKVLDLQNNGTSILSADVTGNTINIGITGSTNANSTIHIADSSAGVQTVTIGSTNSTSTTTIQAGSGGISLNGNTTISGSNTFATGTGTASLNGNTTVASGKSFTANGSALFKINSDSATAFQIQNASALQLVNVDTRTDNSNLITNGSFETNTSGWSAYGSSTLTRITTQHYHATAALKIDTTASANDGAKYDYSLASSTQYTLTLYAKASGSNWNTLQIGRSENGSADTNCLTGQTVVTPVWTRYSCTFTTGTTSGSPYVYVKQSDATARTFYLDAVKLELGATSTAYTWDGITNLGTLFGIGTILPTEALDVNGNIYVHNNALYFGDNKEASIQFNGTNITVTPGPFPNRFVIQTNNVGVISVANFNNTDGSNGSGTGMLFSAGAQSDFIGGVSAQRVDGTNTNSRIVLRVLSNGGLTDTTTNAPLYIEGTTSGPLLGARSTALFRNLGDSTTAFQVQNNAGTNFLAIDTSGNIVNIGITGSTNANSTIHIADSSAGVQTVTIGSTNSTSTTTIQAGSGGISLNGNTSVAGANTFNTGTGAVGLNGDTTVASGKNFTQSGTGTFSTGSGTNSLNGDTTVASGKNFTQSGTGTFSTGSGTNSLNGDTTVASGKNFTVTSGTTSLTGATTINTSGSANTTIGSTGGGTITLGATSGSNLILQDADWNITGAGAATFASVATSGDHSFTNTAANTGSITKSFIVGSGGVNQNDVVVMTNTPDVQQTTIARDPTVYGVSKSTSSSGQNATIATWGNYTVNVDTAAVAIGDQLVTSTVAGRATADNKATTGIIGIALSSKSGGANGTVSILIRPVGGQYTPIFKSSSGSTTAFQVQNSGGTNFFAIDTSGNIVNIGITGSTNTNSTIHIADSTAGIQTVTIGSTNSTSSTTIQSGSTGISLDGNTTVAGSHTFNTGTGTVALNGDTTVASGKNFTQSGGGTFSSGSGTNTLSGDTTVAAGKTFTVTSGDTTLGANLSVTGTYNTNTFNSTTLQFGGASGAISSSAGNLSIQAATTNSLLLDTGGAGTVGIATANATTINVATNNIAHAIHIGDGGTSTAQTITIGSSGAASSAVTINAGSSGGVSINGNTTISGNNTFNTGTGTVALNGDTTVASGKNFTQSGAGTFSTGSGTNSLNGDTTIASGKTFTANGTTSINTAGTANTTIGNTGGGTITLGASSGSNLILQDAEWNITGAGAATFASITTSGDFAFSSSSASAGNITKDFIVGTGGVNANDVVVMTTTPDIQQTTLARDATVYGVSKSTKSSAQTGTFVTSGNYTINVDLPAVAIGDQLITSTTAGRATVDNNATTGIIGIALSSKSAGSNGTVSILVRPVNGRYTPTFRGAGGSSTAFQVQTSGGTNLLAIDTSSNILNLGITGSTNVNSTIHIADSTAGIQTVTIGSTNSSSATTIQSGSTGISLDGNTTIAGSHTFNTGTGTVSLNGDTTVASGKTFTTNGDTLVKTNSSTAFRIQNTSSRDVLNVNTNTTTVTVGNGTDGANLTVGGAGGSGTLTNNGSTKNTTLALGDLAGGSIGSAASTVDIYTSFSISPSASGRTYTIPAPTDGAVGRLIFISNINGSNTFTIGSTLFNSHSTGTIVYDGTGWNFAGMDGGSNNYIQNQNSSTQTANFRINGTGQAAGFDGLASSSLAIGGSNATSVTIGNTANSTGTTLRSTNQTTALQVQNTSTRNILAVDTSGSIVTVGNSTDGAQLTLGATGNANSAIRKTMVVNGTIAANDLIQIDTANAGQVKQAVASSTNIFGVATSAVGSGSSQDIVISGVYQVNANSSGGTIAVGDTLVSSSTAGQATKSGSTTTSGSVVGIAMSTLSGGKVWVYINLGLGGSDNLQTVYNKDVGSTTPDLKVSSGVGGVDIQDADSTISGSLFTVRASNGSGLGSAIFDVQSTGALALTPTTASSTVVIGSTSQTGTITLGQSTASNTISIGASAGNGNTQTINIGTSSTSGSTTNVTIGSTIAGYTQINNKLGVGTSSTPNETLQVNGAINIGTTSNTNAGTIRYNTTTNDFEGYNGTIWKSMTTQYLSVNPVVNQVKTSDTVINNSSTLQSDSALKFTIGANETWNFRFVVSLVSANNNAAWKFHFDVPQSTTSCTWGYGDFENAKTESNIACTTTQAITKQAANNLSDMYELMGIIVNGSTAQTIALQYAQNVATAANSTVQAGSFLQANRVLSAGDATLSAFVNNGNSFGANAMLGTNDNYDLQLQTLGQVLATMSASNGSATFKNWSNSTAGFSVQDTSGNQQLGVDTTNSRVLIGKTSTYTGNLAFANSSSASTVTLSSGSTSSNYTILLPTNAGSANQCLQYGGSGNQLQWAACGTNSTGLTKNAADSSSASIGSGSYLYTFTNSSSAVTSSVLKLDNGSNTNSTLFATTSGNPASGQAVLFAQNTNASASGKLLDLQSGSSPASVFNVSADGSVAVIGGTSATFNAKVANSSTTAFQVQTAGGTAYLTTDTTNGRIIIGTGSTGQTSGKILVLDSDTNATFQGGTATNTPTEVNGAMYYSSTDHVFMCGVAGSWQTCGGLLGSNTAASTAVNTCTTACASFDNGRFVIPANYLQPGRVIHLYADGVYSTTGTPTFGAWGVYFGSNATTKTSDTLLGGAAATSAALPNNASSQHWEVDYTITCYTTGASGTVSAKGTFTFVQSATTTTSETVLPLSSSSTTTMDTTAAQTIYLFPAWGTSSGSNTATAQQIYLKAE